MRRTPTPSSRMFTHLVSDDDGDDDGDDGDEGGDDGDEDGDD